ncbi:5445_t:CDS:2 [Cetraspora pellucida]|uniref:5445_t:CDS:1 n=1 Tax=Cetraspora pellucida TaxID=1433469 RepID=A0ACA9M6N0_9GLOM|nr:5445_t:CDS:2 [Cetraspora pellucida]
MALTWPNKFQAQKTSDTVQISGKSVHSQGIPDTNTNECRKISDYLTTGTDYLNYSDVKACYDSIPFNKTKAVQTIETIKELLKGFYAFLDQAKEEPKPGYTFTPIDLITELDFFLNRDYSYEYEFVYDIGNLIDQLRDGHTTFTSKNFSYYFYQGFSMYSVIRPDGTQQIKVFDDTIDPSTIDCQVTHIDDLPAIDVITEFARNNLSYSRDLNVRFNTALASLGFGNRDFIVYGQYFTLRFKLPTVPTISYMLNCSDKIFNITREWIVPTIRSNEVYPIFAKYNSSYINETSVGSASLIFDAVFSRFYTLQDFGVVLISTESTADLNNDEIVRFLSDIVVGFKLLADKGITKIVLDFSNNLGGAVIVTDYIIKLLFPNINIFPEDIKVTDVSTAFINEISNVNVVNNLFNYRSYTSTITNNSFNNVDEFIGNNTYTRGVNVPTVSVGGFPNTKFSFASCSGGTRKDSDTIRDTLSLYPNLNNLASRLTLSQDLTLAFTCAEVYSINNPDEVMDFSFRQADYQLYYDEQSARDPSSLWLQAAQYIKKQS